VATLPAALTATVHDPEGDSLTVTFYGRRVTSAGPDFTLVEIPDTQYYTSYLNGGSPATFRIQTQWIAANRVSRNIAYVAHVGDVVQNTDDVPAEWVEGDACMRPLEDPATTLLPEGIPFGATPGNHDIAGSGAVVYYNYYFGASRFAGRSYYGGHYGADNSSWFELFSASGLDFIVIGFKLMWTQDPKVVHWADSLLTVYPNRRAIIVSHYLLDPGPPVTFSPQGQAIYDGLKSHGNVILMICGHYVDEARRSDTYNGHTIHTVMANYQNRARGGDGWLRFMEFSPMRNQIRMRTYSPTLGRFEVDADSSSQFTLPCDLSGGDVGFHPIGTFRRVASGATVSIPWTGLWRGKEYEWYVTVGDGTSTVTGPVSQFTIRDDLPPVVRVSAPNGGEALFAGQWVNVQWSAADDGSGMRDVDLLLSRNGPDGPWETVMSEIPNAGASYWMVDGPGTDNARFAVVARDSSHNSALDSSDRPFRIITGTTGVGEGAAGPLALEPVAPNPTRGLSRFGIVLPEAGKVRLEVLDIGGREVALVADGFEPAGRREFAWEGRSRDGPVPAGIYVVRLDAMGRTLTRKFAIAR